MTIEMEYAVNFLVATIKGKQFITEEQEQTLKERLTQLLIERFENHWYVDKPLKGSAYRCINISIDNNSIDLVLRQAAFDSGISADDLLNIFNKGLALWIDPNDVSCRLGKGAIFPIYRKIAEKKSQSGKNDTDNQRHKQRPQTRPRSITPPQATHSQYQYQRSRSTTPPGFSSMDAGQMFQNIAPTPAPKSYYSAENLHKLWDTIPNTTSYTSHSRTPVSYTTSHVPSYSTNDAVYSFNQYSSYYKPNTSYWKKSTQPRHQPKAYWQDDEVYQRYHWSKSDGSNVRLNNVQSYSSYTTSRQAQEVF